MNPDFAAAIHPFLREVASGPPGMCATVELCADSSKWVQFMDQTINIAYPFEDDPETRLSGHLRFGRGHPNGAAMKNSQE